MYLPNIAAFSTVPYTPGPPTGPPILVAPDEFVVAGYYSEGDGGGGTFVWVPTAVSSSLLDGGVAFPHPADSSGASGYFKRLYSGPINVRWFGAKGDGFTDDTNAVHAARNSVAFANNGTLYFPIGKYLGAFKFEFEDINYHNEINITGDGHGSVLCCNGTKDDLGQLLYNPVVVLGYKMPTWNWARFSNIAIDGQVGTELQACPGIQFANPYNGQNIEAGRWVLERVYITNCYSGVEKPFGNIGNHYIDCTWVNNTYGVYALGLSANNMHSGCDRYSGGHFSGHGTACLRYFDDMAGGGQIIIDGTVFEQNSNAWAIWMKRLNDGRKTSNAICLRNVWFELNGQGDAGGDLYFEGIRSVRIDDCAVAGRVHLIESSVNLYNCQLNADAGHAPDYLYVDEKSSLVAYEHRYNSYPTSKVFVNSISYDGSQDIQNENWQPTSVWGPLRCVNVTKSNESVVLTQQFDSAPEQFDLISGSGALFSHPFPNLSVLGSGSGVLTVSASDHIRSHNVVGIVNPNPNPKYFVWSIHTYLMSVVPPGHLVDELWGEITSGGTSLGRVYFKYDQWVCSYGMKLVDITNGLNIELHFFSGDPTISIPGYNATFAITDYQIITFDDLYSANSYINSREFTNVILLA